MGASGPADDVDDLATVLFTLDEGPLTTALVTALITSAISEWALSRGWSVRREARVGVPLASDADTRPGFIDVVVGRGGNGPDLAIEIDSTDKPWSLTKLRHAAAAGMRPVWVRWGDEVLAVIHSDVDVIQLPARRRPGHRAWPHDQLTLWP